MAGSLKDCILEPQGQTEQQQRGKSRGERRENSEKSRDRGAVSAKAEVASEHPEVEVCAKCVQPRERLTDMHT